MNYSHTIGPLTLDIEVPEDEREQCHLALSGHIEPVNIHVDREELIEIVQQLAFALRVSPVEEPKAETDIKYIEIKEFREAGYLQEVNRRFLHPLGLALEVHVADDLSERLGGVWDYRDDPEGMNFGPGMIDPAKVDRVANEWYTKADVREANLGYVIQKS